MPFYVYILKSEKDGSYYKGYSEDYMQRLSDHNRGLSAYTSSKLPWKLIYVEEYSTKREALIREKKLKACKASYFEWLVLQTTNILKHGL